MVTIPAGGNRGCVNIPILDDLIVEGDETIIVTGSFLNPLSMISFGANVAQVIIADIDSECCIIGPPNLHLFLYFPVGLLYLV